MGGSAHGSFLGVIDRRQAFETNGFAELLHRERWAGIVLALRRDVFVTHNVVEVVMFLQRFREGKTGFELRRGVFLPQLDGSPVFMLRADGAGFQGMFSKCLRAFDRPGNIVARVRKLDADREAVAADPDSVRWILPATHSRMSGRPIEGATLEDGPVAINNNMGTCAVRFGTFPEVDGTLRAHAGSEMDNEQATNLHFIAAWDDRELRAIEKIMIGNIHGVLLELRGLSGPGRLRRESPE